MIPKKSKHQTLEPSNTGTLCSWTLHRSCARKLLDLQGSCSSPNPNGDCASKPRVARNELPWVGVHRRVQPQRGCGIVRWHPTAPWCATIRATVDPTAPSSRLDDSISGVEDV